MGEAVCAETAEHYVWGAGSDGWHLVRDARLSVIEERMPPGASEQRHVHANARQFFYVLGGELTMDVEGQSRRLGARQGMEIAPGQCHQVRNESEADARFLVISAPPAQGDRQAC